MEEGSGGAGSRTERDAGKGTGEVRGGSGSKDGRGGEGGGEGGQGEAGEIGTEQGGQVPSGVGNDVDSASHGLSTKKPPPISTAKASPDLKAPDANTRKYQAMIDVFDRKYPGLKPEPRIERWKLEGEEEIDGLLEQMLSKDQEEVAAAATRLRHIITGDDAAASAVRIKLLATPLAIDTICQSIIMAEELWEVIYPFGVTVRASSNQKSNRIGNLPIGTRFSVTSISLGWLKLKRPPAPYTEGWVRVGSSGKEQVVRQSDDSGKVAVMNLLMTLSQLSFASLALSSMHGLRLLAVWSETHAAYILLEAPFMRQSFTLCEQTRAGAPPLRQAWEARVTRVGVAFKAKHFDAEHGPGEAGLTRHQRPHSNQPEGWYGTGIHSIIAPPPVTSLRAYTTGIRLPMANLERRSKTPVDPLHVASHVSTFDWAS